MLSDWEKTAKSEKVSKKRCYQAGEKRLNQKKSWKEMISGWEKTAKSEEISKKDAIRPWEAAKSEKSSPETVSDHLPELREGVVCQWHSI